ncbi:MAG: hypothetical protein QXJ32_02195 [Thermoplasmata archaeon]
MSTSRREGAERRLRRIRLHTPEGKEPPDLLPVREYLDSMFDDVQVRLIRSPFARLSGPTLDRVARQIAQARTKDPTQARQTHIPTEAEVDYERRAIRGTARLGGIPYDGRSLLDLYSDIMSRELDPTAASIVFTNRLITTFSRDDLRHHLRMLVCGFPSIISVPGVVEAPARPREYYVLRRELEVMGAAPFQLERLKDEFKGRFIGYGDEAVIEVLKGLALQAVMFHMTLEPFCDSRYCRLFNAHWQEELVQSQLRGDRFCPRHAALVARLRRRPTMNWLS